MHYAVVGAGWAGLAAAIELTRRGQRVSLFEAGKQAGGRARSVFIEGRSLDNGQHILLGAYRACLELMQSIGIDLEQAFVRYPLQVVDNAGFQLALPNLPAPLNVAWALLSAKNVSLREKLSTAVWMEGIKRQHFRLAEDCTVAQWLDAGQQRGILRRHLWEPLCLAALNTPAHRASAQLFANVLRDSLGSRRRADTDLLLPRRTLGETFPTPAIDWLKRNGADIQFSHRVRELAVSSEKVRLDSQNFSAVILALAPQHLNSLFPEAAMQLAYEPIATVYLDYGPGTQLHFPLQALQGGHGQWVIDRGNGLLACVLSGHGEWETLDDAGLVEALHKELGMHQPPHWHKVIREKRATFAATPSLQRPGAQTRHSRILLAGDYTWADYPATLEGAVRSGLRAARILTA